MAWLVLFLVSFFMSALLVGKKGWVLLWPMGLVALVVVYVLDVTLIRLGAFTYKFGLPILGGLPPLYFLSGLFNGVTVARFYPARRWLRLPYIILLSAAYLLVEWLMIITGNFSHANNWSFWRSLGLNVTGFTLLFWLGEWLGVIKPGR
ncbi:hypothetical protein [Desulfofundulus thermocisternus]|uniref:hypothetical protein n=1 Tax=Desulfofundulus thermocisternus TaxID=42471 RepID=UPI0019ED0ABD|nr:hypothetical protein [Desulfofundulus thermocisternus]MBE3585181.1 hypothetical protein [Thermoanaerobacter sp.]MCS5696023.1 hypothetical protein [Desulfofundulus thermocisternus]